jgi:hypothetical protein
MLELVFMMKVKQKLEKYLRVEVDMVLFFVIIYHLYKNNGLLE